MVLKLWCALELTRMLTDVWIVGLDPHSFWITRSGVGSTDSHFQ